MNNVKDYFAFLSVFVSNKSFYTKINLTKEWLIYFKIPSRIFEIARIRELRNRNGQINK